jgi:hypothetical protein
MKILKLAGLVCGAFVLDTVVILGLVWCALQFVHN